MCRFGISSGWSGSPDPGSALLQRRGASCAGRRMQPAPARAVARDAIGRVRIGICDEALGAEMAVILRAARLALPDVELTFREMTSSVQLNALHHNGIDLGVLVISRDSASLAIDPLWREGKAVALLEAYPLAQQARVSVPELLASGLLVSGDLVGHDEEDGPDPALTRGLMRFVARSAGRPVDGRRSGPSWSECRRSAGFGNGLGDPRG